MILSQIGHIIFKSKKPYFYLLLFLAISYCSTSYSQNANEDNLKTQANNFFEDENYNSAYNIYAQLVSLYPKDPDYNFKLGVCMLFIEPDKKKPIPYLQVALKNPQTAPKDAKFYLAKAYHVNYRFDEAIRLYTEYKQIGSSSSIKKFEVDREIQACVNGKRLLSNLSDLIVTNKKQLNEADYFRAYDIKDIGGKLLAKPEDYKSSYDKKKKDKSIVYLPRSANRLYYSSYGESGNTGRDLYFVNKLPNGTWSKAQILPNTINTPYDEDYPFLHPNGKTLYFSSKGHNSMGGYDIFKTNFDENSQSWSTPVNLEFPINSPDDDILFVTDSLETTAFFSTGRYSPYGKIDVLKINTERKPLNIAVLKGTTLKENVSQSLQSKITVKDISNGEIVGTYQAQENGDYNMELPNGGKFIFTVETPGLTTQSEGVQIPIAYSLKPYKQTISYENKILKIKNYFDGNIADENYSMLIDLIERKAKLDVNENEGPKNLNSVSTTNPTIATTTEKENTNKNVTNDQLLSIAKEDAKEAGDEASKLKQEAQDAFGLATQKTAESVSKQKEADQALINANSITDVAKKNEELSKAKDLTEDAKTASDVANLATNIAKKLEVDAINQQKEADLTNQYISQLEAVIKNKNNKEALTKLENIQKELDGLAKQKNQSDEVFTSLKAEAELKQQELITSEKKSASILNEITALKTETENLGKDLTNETDKSLKENIAAQIRELTSEIELKNKDLATNNQKNELLKDEVNGVNQELQIAAKLLNEKTDDLSVSVPNNITSNENEIHTTENNVATLNKEPEKNTENEKTTPVSNSSIKSSESTSVTINNEKLTENKNDNIAIESNNITPNTGNAAQLLTEADNLSTRAVELRKEANSKNGVEKETLLMKASENEKLSIDKKIEASTITKTENENKFEINTSSLIVLQKLTGEKTSNDISQANLLVDEAALNYKQAQKMRTEAEAYPSGAAKLGGLGNAEEKENEALAKQQKALELLQKENPNYKSKVSDVATNNTPSAEKTESALNLSTNPKLDAAIANQKQNVSIFETNISKITDLQKQNANNTSNEATQANALVNEAAINFKQAQKIRAEAEANPSMAARLGGLSNAEEKENEALAKQQKAIDILSKAKTFDEVQTPVAAETSSSTATNTITEIAKTETETESLLKQTIESEKQSTEKKLEVAINTEKQNASTFENNSSNLAELQKTTETSNSPEITEAKKLVNEATVSFKQAQKMRAEANANSSPAAKLGGISNAEEKENEAIAKQQKAVELLSKSKTTDVIVNSKPELNSTSEVITNTTETTTSQPTNTVTAINTNTLTNNETTTQPETNNSESVNISGISEEANKLKGSLNNVNEKTLVTFNGFNNKGAIALKNQAAEKIKLALNEDSKLSQSLDNINRLSSDNISNPNNDKEVIADILANAETLKNNAEALRKSAETKTGVEKEKDLNDAKTLETNALNKKIDAANKQKQLNRNSYDTNKQTLEEYAKFAKDKNIDELSTADKITTEAYFLFLTQAKKLRDDADANPNETAKLEGYKNAEDKESQALSKQQALLELYKKNFPDFTPPKPSNADIVSTYNQTKSTVNANNQLHIDGLMLLSDAIDKEYKERYLNLPTISNTDQASFKTRAQIEYKSAKTILEQVKQTTDLSIKKNLLVEANTSGQNAINLLMQISNTASDIASNNPNSNNSNIAAASKSTSSVVKFKTDGIVVKNSNAYTANKPIPIDEKIPDGLVFKVQIGAFKTALPNNTFKGLSPIIAQTTPSGYIRYMAGDFEQYNSANSVKNDLRNLGYKDAFVVAYFNGKRITLGEATDKARAGGQTIETTENTNVVASVNTQVNVEPTNITPANNTVVNTTVTSPPAEIANELEKMNGLLYTVQIGVYSQQVTKAQLFNLKPIYSEKLPNGLYRYTAGIYNQANKITNDKQKLVELGIKDAFVSSYYNAKRISFDEGKKLQTENNNLKMEDENPIIFSDEIISAPLTTNSQTVVVFSNVQTPSTNNTTNVTAFTNGVTSGPAPTAENGVKSDEAGVSYKVQIGAYRNQVPNDVASKFLNIKTWPVKNVVINNLFIYTIGNFIGVSFAKKLKEEAISYGITDAYITVYKDGQKLYGAEALKYLSQ